MYDLAPDPGPNPSNNQNKQDVDYFPLLQGELKGGVASELLTIPLAIGFGLFAFAPLGPRFTQLAILAGLYSAIIVPIVAVLLRSNSSVVFAPRNMTSYLISGVITHLLAVETASDFNDPSQLLAMILVIMLTAGVIQSLFGMLRMGEAVKYIPPPVPKNLFRPDTTLGA